MGLYNRDYYKEHSARSAWQPSTGSQGPRSVVTTLVIINCVIFLIDAFTPDVGQGRWLAHTMALKTDLWSHPWNVWQLFSYGFAHASINSPHGLWHILGNMIALFFLGRPVEQRLGRTEFLRFYLVALLLSGVMWLVLRSLMGQPGMVLGASGAVTAVVLLFVFCYPREKVYLWGVLGLPAWLLGVLLVGLDLTRAFRPDSVVAAEAHLTGAAFAAGYFFFRWNLRWLNVSWATRPRRGKPRLRVHRPEDQFERLRAQADRILDKVHRQGEQSLTRAERRTLEQYSRQLRQRSP